MAPSPGRSTRPAATSHLPLSIHLTTFNPAQPALQNQFSNSTPLRISARNLAAPAIPKQMNCKPLRDRLTETPYERARARPASYTDAEILELAEPGRVISVQQNLTTGERMSIDHAELEHTRGNTNAIYVPKLPDVANIWAPGESLANFSKAQILACSQEFLRKCILYQQNFATAVQHFDTYNQICSDRRDDTTDVLATYQAVKRAGENILPRNRAYMVAISKYRNFVLNLLDRLPAKNGVRVRITPLFIKLSCDYESKENGIREAMHDIFLKQDGDAKKKLQAWITAFKQRGELLMWQQKRLEMWAMEVWEELVNRFGEF